MNRIANLILGLGCALSLSIAATIAANNDYGSISMEPPIPASLVVPDELIVEVTAGTKYLDSVELFKAAGAKSFTPLSMEGWLVTFAPGELANGQAKLKKTPGITGVQRNFRLTQCSNATGNVASQAGQQSGNSLSASLTPKDPYFASEWHLAAVRCGSDQPKPGVASFNGVVLLDNGCTKEAKNIDCNTMNGNFDLGMGSWSSGTGAINEKHGTMLATTIGGTWNEFGTAGVMRTPRTWSVRMTKYGTGQLTEADLIKGLMWGRANVGNTAGYPWATVVPMNIAPPYSLSSKKYHPAFHHLCRNIHDYMSGSIFLAAGNDGKFDNSPRRDYLQVVSACDQAGNLLPISNYGNCVTLIAPGKNIYCTNQNGEVLTGDGTSFAAAITAGVEGIIHNRARDYGKFLHNNQLETLLQSTASAKPPGGWSTQFGFGMPDYRAAIKAVKQ